MIAWSLSLGLQLMVAALFCRGAATLPYALECEYARLLARPEREIPLYVLGILVTLGIALAAVGLWQRAARRVTDGRDRFVALSQTALGVIGVAGLLLFLALATNRMTWFFIIGGVRTMSVDPEAWKLFLPAGLTLFAGWACFLPDTLRRLQARLPAGWWRARGPVPKKRDGPAEEPPVRWGWGDLGVAVALFALLFLPLRSAGELAGRIYLDEALHHWNYFAMGPAVALQHGLSLGTEVYSQYGVGWPVLFAGGAGLVPLSYAGMITIGSLCVAGYYVGLYALLRTLLRHRVWAAAGTFLAVYWEMACGIPELGPWQCPSSTPMRHPMDVWYLLALLAFLRSGRLRWAALAGVCLGTGVAFAADTGLFLLPLFVMALVLRVWRPGGRVTRGALAHAARAVLAWGVCAAGVLLLFLAAAGGRTIFEPAFWAGWTEGMRAYTRLGVGSMLLMNVTDGALASFVLILAVYLCVLVRLVLTWLRAETTPGEILLGCVAAYGCMTLLIFVSRSCVANLFHPLASLAILVTCLACRGVAVVTRPTGTRWIPAAGLFLAVGLLFSTRTLRDYPERVRAYFDAPPAPAGVPAAALSLPDATRAVCQRAGELARQGKRIAVVTDDDVTICLATGLRPWTRYTPPEPLFFQPQALQRFLQRLRAYAPDVVVLRPGKAWPDVAQACRQDLAAGYALRETIGRYEVWERRQKEQNGL